MARRLKVIVIGSGIGGMTAAAALHQDGHEITVYERAPALGEVGAGLQVAPNAVKVMNALGLGDDLRRISAEPADMVSLRWDDATLRYREPLKTIAQERYGARYLMAHRADLHALLCAAVPEAAVVLGAECVSVQAVAGAGASVTFADGTTAEADVVIGADGIHSVVRTVLFGRRTPRFTNQICWRAQVPIELMPTQVGPGRSVVLGRDDYVGWLGPVGHVLFYPIRSGKVLNIFAGRVSEEWVDESWSTPSSREEMKAAYAGWNPAMLDVFDHVENVFRWGIYDHEPLPCWTSGRISLLGDAAHPMMPTLAQGAAQAMEDGYALARHLAQHADPADGLLAYEAERRPHTAKVQLQARQQFDNNRQPSPPPPLSRDWIFKNDVTRHRASAA